MMNPEDGRPARLFRYVECMPLPDIVSMFFEHQNLLMIDRELYEKLSDDQRHRVLRTEEKTLRVHFPPNRPPVVYVAP